MASKGKEELEEATMSFTELLPATAALTASWAMIAYFQDDVGGRL
jgi:hypothetical protein